MYGHILAGLAKWSDQEAHGQTTLSLGFLLLANMVRLLLAIAKDDSFATALMVNSLDSLLSQLAEPPAGSSHSRSEFKTALGQLRDQGKSGTELVSSIDTSRPEHGLFQRAIGRLQDDTGVGAVPYYYEADSVTRTGFGFS